MNTKKIMQCYLIVYGVLMLMYCSINRPSPNGEWDDYSLPVASLIAEHNFSISSYDIEYYKELFPEWADYVENYHLSGYVTRKGGEMTWYFPTYSAACIPIVLLLQILKLPTVYTFAFTNLSVMMLLLFSVYQHLQVGDRRKLLMIVLLSVNPIIFYFSWTSAEVFIYAMLGLAMIFWYNQWYKRAAIFVSIAGMLNPTIMVLGIVMIFEYLIRLLRTMKPGDKLIIFIKTNLWNVIFYGACYLIGLIPMFYNYYNTGHINLTASYDLYLTSNESVFERFLSYLFDLNYGLLPYYSFILVMAFVLLGLAIIKRHWRYIEWIIALLINVLSYSIMIHINHGMSGIARYNAWAAVILIFAVCLYYDQIISNEIVKKIFRFSFVISVILTGCIVYAYGPNRADKVYYKNMTPIAAFVLDNVPALYDPLHSTFNSRVMHVDGGYYYELPISYCGSDGDVRKILASKENVEQLLREYTGDEESMVWFEKQVLGLTEKEEYISVPKKYKIVQIEN